MISLLLLVGAAAFVAARPRNVVAWALLFLLGAPLGFVALTGFVEQRQVKAFEQLLPVGTPLDQALVALVNGPRTVGWTLQGSRDPKLDVGMMAGDGQLLVYGLDPDKPESLAGTPFAGLEKPGAVKDLQATVANHAVGLGPLPVLQAWIRTHPQAFARYDRIDVLQILGVGFARMRIGVELEQGRVKALTHTTQTD